MNLQRIQNKMGFLCSKKKRKSVSPFCFIILVFIISACSSIPDEAKVTIPPSPAISANETPIPTAPAPTSTPIQEQVIFLISDNSVKRDIDVVESVLMKLADHDGLNLIRSDGLGQQELDPGTRVVVALSPSQEIGNFASTNPETQFVVISAEPFEPSSNLSIIPTQSSRPDQQGFLAGYLSAVITSQWRIGVVGSAEDQHEKAKRNGFSNGMVFYCGLCRPSIPPFIQYPLSISLPVGAGALDFQTAVDQLLANAVQTVYVSFQTGDPAFLEALANAGIQIIGTEPPLDSIRNQYVATVGVNLGSALEKMWPSLLSGTGGQSADPDLFITDVNQDLFTIGRVRFVNQMLSNLQSGYIDTGVDPISGELQ